VRYGCRPAVGYLEPVFLGELPGVTGQLARLDKVDGLFEVASVKAVLPQSVPDYYLLLIRADDAEFPAAGGGRNGRSLSVSPRHLGPVQWHSCPPLGLRPAQA
jgi:hypothetical protein